MAWFKTLSALWELFFTYNQKQNWFVIIRIKYFFALTSLISIVGRILASEEDNDCLKPEILGKLENYHIMI